MNSVLLDTSFLISLSDPTRPHHNVAKRYYRECIERRVPMYLSTIVASEFHARQSINDLELRNFIVLPFNIDHAMTCGLLLHDVRRDASDDRVRIKDDFKLMAQCECEGISHLLAEDGAMAKYVRRLNAAGRFMTKVVLLKDGYDPARFDGDQLSIGLAPLGAE